MKCCVVKCFVIKCGVIKCFVIKCGDITCGVMLCDQMSSDVQFSSYDDPNLHRKYINVTMFAGNIKIIYNFHKSVDTYDTLFLYFIKAFCSSRERFTQKKIKLVSFRTLSC